MECGLFSVWRMKFSDSCVELCAVICAAQYGTDHIADWTCGPVPWDLYCRFCFLSFYLKSICRNGCLTGTGVESGSEVLLSPETFVHLLLCPCVAACQMGPHTVSHCPGSSADWCAGPCLAAVPLPVPCPVLPGTVQDLSGHIPWWVPSSHQEREQTGFKAVGLCFSPSWTLAADTVVIVLPLKMQTGILIVKRTD